MKTYKIPMTQVDENTLIFEFESPEREPQTLIWDKEPRNKTLEQIEKHRLYELNKKIN